VRRCVVLCGLLLASLAFGAPATAGVRDCRPRSTDVNLFDISARNMSCAVALKRIRRVRYVGRSYAPRLAGWRCQTVSNYSEGGHFRCAHRAQAFRWGRGS